MRNGTEEMVAMVEGRASLTKQEKREEDLEEDGEIINWKE